MDDFWGGLILILIVLVFLKEILAFIGTVLGYIGQTFLIAVEHPAHGLAVLGVTNPIAAWLVLGIVVGAAVGAVVGFSQIGMKQARTLTFVGSGAVLLLLLALSSGAPGQIASAPPIVPIPAQPARTPSSTPRQSGQKYRPKAGGGTERPKDKAVYRVGGGVSAPIVLSKTEPEYSEEARRAGLQGTALVQLVVSEEGIPRDVKVIRSLGLGLDEKANTAVQRWRFRPGMKNGVPVAVLASVEVNFRLLGSPLVRQTDSAQSGGVATDDLSEPRRLYAGGEYKAALAACDRVLARDPGNAGATQMRANILKTMSILGVQ